ncbi:leucyl aminopeptidase family protein [Cellulomonas endophytica]|uniref:leucyl aminopeptidase family protein n=1 Tax=Cellulomonas endophytica TaxID=2494735 RepID=UPI0010108E67|nr:leucyl aminopeptidase family protein [Cellulomonas endophytica]
MAPPRTRRSAAPTGRGLPSVTAHEGQVADTPLLLDGVDALAVPVGPAAADDEELTPGAGTAEAAARYGIDLADVAERARLTGAPGEAYVLQLPRPVGSRAAALPWAGLPPRLVLVGVGDGGPVALRRAGAALARSVRGLGRVVTTIGAAPAVPSAPRERGQAPRDLVEGYLLAAYAVPTRSSRPGAAPRPAADLVLLGPDAAGLTAQLAAATTAAAATWLTRDLANEPSDVKTPAWVADTARRRAAAAGLEVRVLGPRELAAEGFGGILAVGRGSASPPRLVEVRYEPPAPAEGAPATGPVRHVVLVGKGITFDTGGISLKPRESMPPMKTDMAGAAAALAAVLAAPALGVRHRVTALLPLAENHLGAASYRPGDVVTTYGGRTIEVDNTDAEGRVVLADALAYADAVLEPDLVVDVATLTGASTVTFGRTHAALYATDDALADALRAAGEATGEAVWRMPLVEDYAAQIVSDVADVRQTARDRQHGAGAVVAALILREFTGGRPWAHLDVAGPARSTADSHEVVAGATGFGARLLLRFLVDLP